MGLRLVKSGGKALVLTPEQQRVMRVALEMYGSGCIEAIRAMAAAGDEEKRLEFACRYDTAQTLAEQIAGLS